MIRSRCELAGIHHDYCPTCGNQLTHHWAGCPQDTTRDVGGALHSVISKEAERFGITWPTRPERKDKEGT